MRVLCCAPECGSGKYFAVLINIYWELTSFFLGCTVKINTLWLFKDRFLSTKIQKCNNISRNTWEVSFSSCSKAARLQTEMKVITGKLCRPTFFSHLESSCEIKRWKEQGHPLLELESIRQSWVKLSLMAAWTEQPRPSTAHPEPYFLQRPTTKESKQMFILSFLQSEMFS